MTLSFTCIISKLQGEHKKSFNQKKFLLIMIGLIVTSIIDISIVKINDLIDKYFIPLQGKIMLFAVNSSVCLLLQFFLIRYIQSSFQSERLNRTLKVKAINSISFISLCILASLIGFVIFQLFNNNYYYTDQYCDNCDKLWNSGSLIIWLSSLFLSWYKSSHNMIVLLYFISISDSIQFNYDYYFASLKVNDSPHLAGEFVGGSGIYLVVSICCLIISIEYRRLCHLSAYGLQRPS